MYQNLAVLGAFVFLYSSVAARLERTSINGALVFVFVGLAFGPLGLGLLNLSVDEEGLRTLAELTLALVLFTDAANSDLSVLRSNIAIPRRLLLIGLPLTILLGFALGFLMFDQLGLIEIAVLATMLAPTDAALGKAVVTNEAVPSRIRQGLNVESGLNDGICVPILFLFLILATQTVGEQGNHLLALKLVAEEIGIGVAVGVVLTLAGAWTLKESAARGWVTESWRQVCVPALALACFATAQYLGGSGFIACFVGGMLFGWRAAQRKHALLLAAEGTGDTLAMLTWVVFGAGAVANSLGSFGWNVVLYSALSLTVIRMLPVFIAMTGMGLRLDEKLFIGWFGPRGLASIVFAVIVLNEHLPGGDTITMTVVCTITLSVLAHGLSANPLVALLARRIKQGS
jgi:NhaP-type Na+/H+ or K+/H+ antiporter